ncbi:MAG: GNAT family protein [Gaiellales bacterium]
MAATRLTGKRVVLRSSTRADTDALYAIASEPVVTEWWGEPSRAALEAELSGDEPELVSLVIEVEGQIAGAIQFHEELEPDFKHAGIDLFLGSAWHGQGLGTEAISLLVDYLCDERGHHRLTIDPAADNARAIRSYEKAGFRPVGVMRRYQHLRGAWRDGLLMELVRNE